MKNNLNKPKYIIILGTTFSGSGAVSDYLIGRGDINDPLGGQEYLLPILPNGLMALESISDKSFDPATAEYVLSEFKSIADKLMSYWTKMSKDKNLIKKIPFYKKFIEEFINDVSIADFPMRLLWREELLKSPVEIFIEKIQRRFGIKKKVSKTRLIKSKEELVIAAQNMHDKMFRSNEDDRPVLLDQGGSGWNPIESTKYFLDCKVVLVTRDPRDQFAEIKYYKKGTSVNGFVDWYKEMQRRLKQINDPKVLLISFEDFVLKNKNFTEKLCNHLSLSLDNLSDYQPDFSKKNIAKFKQFISPEELKIIESNLGEYILE